MIYYPKNIEELKIIISQYDTISFDVWDTLITRIVLEPEDVFTIVENRIKEMGIPVENYKEERKKAILQVECPNPNIEEIYRAMQKETDISDWDLQRIMELEIQTERDVICPRYCMVKLMQYAIESGKQVHLVTDMYLPKEVMENLLEQLEIDGYKDMFVSCEYRELKIENLFSIYKEKVRGTRYLHIGDNPKSDVMAAEENGIDAVKIKSGKTLIEETVYSKLVNMAVKHNIRCMVGLFVAQMFNSPFPEVDEDGRGIIKSAKSLARCFIAPIVSEFMIWLYQNLLCNSYDGILFSARDGFLIQKLYEIMRENWQTVELPEGKYFLTSRELCTFSGITSYDEIVWLSLVKFNGSKQELMKYRFCLEEKEIIQENEIDNQTVSEYVLAHEAKIWRRSEEVRKDYLKYMKQIGLQAEKKYAIFDFVSSGTCQYYLNKFVPFKIEGKYFCRSITEDEKTKLVIDSLYVNNGVESADSILFKNYRYLETIMTSDMPSLRYIDSEGKPVYDDETRSKEEIEFVHQVHEGIEAYFKEYIRICNRNDRMNLEVPEMMFLLMGAEYTKVICKSLDSMHLRDDWVREDVEK